MKTLVIVESPTKCAKIQQILGDKYLVMSSKGHITDLAKGGKFGLGIDIDNNFKPRYVINQDKLDIVNNLLEAAKKADKILLFADPDREGEAISWHLRERLKDTDKPILRGTFKEITKKAILDAIKNTGDVNEHLFKSQEARRMLDRIVGFMASSYLMNYFGQGLSAGRVQSVVSRMIIDREAEIDKFVPEEYWNIFVNLSKNNKDNLIVKYDLKVKDQKTANEIVSLSKSVAKFIVKDVISSEEKKSPPPPLNTAALQQIMSKNFGISADKVMKAAQFLYENGYCTYIRTDSVRTEDDALNSVRDFISKNNYKLPKKPNIFKNKDAAQDAHECIRPTDLELSPFNNVEIIDPTQKKVYETIWKYFVASQMSPAIFNTLKITVYPEGNKNEIFKATGKAIKELGYLEILGTNANSEINLPLLSKDDELILFGDNAVKSEKKHTQPPPRYTQHALGKELEDRGIGRPATYAEIFSKIAGRGYVIQDGSVYKPTDLGKKVNEELIKFFEFMDYDYTSTMEKKLDDIAEAKADQLNMLKDFFITFKKSLDKAYISKGASLCDKCGFSMVEKISKKGEKFIACSNYPKCRNILNKNLKAA